MVLVKNVSNKKGHAVKMIIHLLNGLMCILLFLEYSINDYIYFILFFYKQYCV